MTINIHQHGFLQFIRGQSLIDYPYDHASPEALETNTDKPRILVNTVYNILSGGKRPEKKRVLERIGRSQL